MNEGALVGFDLDQETGNQNKATLSSVQANDEILVSVYTSNTSEIIGYTLTVAYDTTQVQFKRVDENVSDGEKNLLFAKDGSAVFILTPPKEGQVALAGAILGPTAETSPSGDGLLGVFRFIAQEDFSETEFRIAQLILQSGAVQDTIVTLAEATISSTSPDTSAAPVDPGEEVLGPVLIDLNPSEGNQNLENRTGVKAGDTITLQLFSDDFPEVTGFGLNVEFDQIGLEYVDQSFAVGDFISGASPLATNRGGVIDIGVASLSGNSGSGDGYLGQLEFKITDAFSDSSYVAVTTVGFSIVGGGLQEQAMRVIGWLQAEGSVLVGDFDGDGVVGFRDFLGFAQAFGGSDAQYDLDGDGLIGFRDFLTFAQQFGKSIDNALMGFPELGALK